MSARKRIIVVLVLLLLIAAATLAAFVPGSPARSLVFGRVATDGQVRVSGNIEATDAEVSFKIPGRVATRPVDEGESVDAGQVVATLETADLECELALRQAELRGAEASLDELRNGSRREDKQSALAAMQQAFYAADELISGSRPQQIQIARAEYEAALTESMRLVRELGRASELLAGRAIPQEQYDRARAACDVAARRLRQASEQLSLSKEGAREQQIDQSLAAFDQATARYDLVMAGPREETIRQAEARVAQAKAAAKLAQTRLDYATITSPLGGVVLSKNIEPGEYVAPGTSVVTVGDLVHVWLRAYITADELPRVKVGQRASVSIDSRGGKTFEGRVSFISSKAEFTPKNVQTEKERVKLVYRIKIDITNPDMELKPGMPADAVILADR